MLVVGICYVTDKISLVTWVYLAVTLSTPIIQTCIFLPLEHIKLHHARRNLIPISMDSYGQQKILLVMADTRAGSLNVKRGNILCQSLNNRDYFLMAENFSAFLENYIVNCEFGSYRISDVIDLFPLIPKFSETTNGVTIEASPLFIPEKSLPGDRYFWAYSIHIYMADDVPQNIHNCQLESRHWEIESEGRVEPVDGPGVIGLYPKMFPSAHFYYQSCCPLNSVSGSMKGSFRMVREDGSSFDAIVPTFYFKIPDVLK